MSITILNIRVFHNPDCNAKNIPAKEVRVIHNKRFSQLMCGKRRRFRGQLLYAKQYYSNYSNPGLLSRGNLGTLVRICQKEHSNRTPAIVLQLTDSERGLRPKLAALLSNVDGLKAGPS
jgi:hypothetical protein